MLTITLLTKNEEANLRRTLQAIQTFQKKRPELVTEILVLDCGSEDATEQVAKEFGARWEVQPWLGFGLQKQKATLLAKNDWILNLDADEVPTNTFWMGLENFLRIESDHIFAATISRDTVFLGRRLRYGGAGDQRKIRLFRRDKFNWNDAQTHEEVVSVAQEEKVGHVSGSVLHYSWENTSNAVRTLDSYATQIALKKFKIDDMKTAFGFSLYFRFFAEFFRSFVMRLGFLDGVAGFSFCFLMAFSHELKFIKLYELRQSQMKSSEAEFPKK